jgi:hypothetical protein
MDVRIWSSRIWLASALVIAFSCGRHNEARTAKEFVEQYSAAWQREDVDAIVSMQYDLRRFDTSKIPPGKEAAIVEYGMEKERKRVEADIAARGFAYRAGANLSYVSEQDHGDHIHVRVAIGAARSEIVLVRDGELLKSFPYPSWFN